MATETGRQGEGRILGFPAHVRDKDVDRLLGQRGYPGFLYGEDDALDPRPESNPRRIGGAQGCRKRVVPSSGAENALRTLRTERHELEHRPRVIVQPAHESVVHRELRAQTVETVLQLAPVLGACLTEVVDHVRSSRDDLL